MYKIEKLDHKGRGITFINNKIAFVFNALTDEVVDVKILNEKSKYIEAKMTSLITPSINRVEPICPYFLSCGGCDIMHLKYEEQLSFKVKKVKEILNKFGHIDINDLKIIETKPLYYRNKATFQVKQKIGFYKKESYDIIPIDKCFIVDDKINNLLTQIKKQDLKNIKQIVIRSLEETMVIFKTSGEIRVNIDEIDSNNIVVYENNNYRVLKGKDVIVQKLGDLKFIVSPDSFFQVNSDGAFKLYSQILKYLDLKGNEKILDLFCGTGTIGIFLSRFCKSVVGIELNKNAVEDARKNAKINGINNINFICDDASNYSDKNYDVVIVDPPRSGLSKKNISYLNDLAISKLIYVSCDPVTLARDLKLLSSVYELKGITLVDMFPNTSHVESVCLLKLR